MRSLNYSLLIIIFAFFSCKKDKNIIKKAIVHSCKIKSKIVEKDEKEKNLRKVLNFGHTFAHGFEAAKKINLP